MAFTSMMETDSHDQTLLRRDGIQNVNLDSTLLDEGTNQSGRLDAEKSELASE